MSSHKDANGAPRTTRAAPIARTPSAGRGAARTAAKTATPATAVTSAAAIGKKKSATSDNAMNPSAQRLPRRTANAAANSHMKLASTAAPRLNSSGGTSPRMRPITRPPVTSSKATSTRNSAPPIIRPVAMVFLSSGATPRAAPKSKNPAAKRTRMLSASRKPLTGSGDQAMLTAAQASPSTSNSPMGVRIWPSAASITLRRGATKIAARRARATRPFGANSATTGSRIATAIRTLAGRVQVIAGGRALQKRAGRNRFACASVGSTMQAGYIRPADA